MLYELWYMRLERRHHGGVEEVRLHQVVVRQGICRSFRDEKPFQLRKFILFYIPLVENRWFDPAVEILDENG